MTRIYNVVDKQDGRVLMTVVELWSSNPELCKTCGCCDGCWNDDRDRGEYFICSGGCERGEVHYLEQFR